VPEEQQYDEETAATTSTSVSLTLSIARRISAERS
jgi:hypothetical protein